MTTDRHGIRQALLEILAAALSAVDGRAAVRAALAERPARGPAWICAVGKAAEAMALGAMDHLGDAVAGGLLVTKVGHLDPTRFAHRDAGCSGNGAIVTCLGGHPVPDAGSLDAGRHLLAALERLPTSVLVLFLISGGTSSLLEVPVRGLALADLQRMNAWLLASGLPIDAMNRVRKAVSLIKGGALLQRLAGRPLRVFAISDVPGDDPAVIGSGLLVPEVGLDDAVAAIALPDWLRGWVDLGLGERGPSLQCGPQIEIVACLGDAIAAAAAKGCALGLPVQVHGPVISGDAASAGHALAQTLMDGPPGLHVWGGETTLCLPVRPGRGGRNQHLALAGAIALAGRADVHLLSVGTDGTDGPTDDAGALVDGATLARAGVAGDEAIAYLERADAGTVLEASGDLIQTGPTGTNVMDLILGYRA
jgi:hydroxypyruvate reductase